MDLDEFTVGVIDALLKERGLRGAGADYGIRGAPENRANAAGGKNNGIGRVVVTSMERKSMAQMPRHTPESSMTADRNVTALEFFDFVFRFVAAHLFIEGVEKLLAGSGACKAVR